MWVFARLGFYISTIKIMATTNKLFICLKETCFLQQLAAHLGGRHTRCGCERGTWKCTLYYCYSTAIIPEPSKQGEGNPVCISVPFGVVSPRCTGNETPWSSVSKALPERSRKGCKTEATLRTNLPHSNNPHLIDAGKSNCFFHWIRNILPGSCENWSHCKGGKF